MPSEEAKFDPLAASIRKTMNVAGKLMQEISEVYPDNKQLAEAHRQAASNLEKIADELKFSANEEVSVPLTCGFIGGYSNLLDLLNKHLLRPLADSQQVGSAKNELKQVAITGILEIAEVFKKDADVIESQK